MLQRLFIRKFHCGLCSYTTSKSSVIKDLLNNSATYEDLKNDSPENDWSTLPYPEGSLLHKDEIKEPVRQKVDPREMSIILFPGQGAHHVGMNKNLLKFPGARDIFALANDILK